MKKMIAALIGIALMAIAGPTMAVSSYQHQAALCAAVDSTRPSVWVLQSLGDEFFDQTDIRTVTDYPVAVRSVFNKQEHERIFLVSRWQGLRPSHSYTFLCQWIDPDGVAYSTSTASFQTPESLDPGIFFTYTASLDLQNEMKEGNWTVEILINGELVEARVLVIASQ